MGFALRRTAIASSSFPSLICVPLHCGSMLGCRKGAEAKLVGFRSLRIYVLGKCCSGRTLEAIHCTTVSLRSKDPCSLSPRRLLSDVSRCRSSTRTLRYANAIRRVERRKGMAAFAKPWWVAQTQRYDNCYLFFKLIEGNRFRKHMMRLSFS